MSAVTFSAPEAARQIGIGYERLCEWMAAGIVPGQKTCGRWRLSERDLERARIIAAQRLRRWYLAGGGQRLVRACRLQRGSYFSRQ